MTGADFNRDKVMQQALITERRRFIRPDDWFDHISPFFKAPRQMHRQGPFSVTDQLKLVGGSLLHDVSVRHSGVAPGRPGFSAEGVDRRRYFAMWQAAGVSIIEQSQCRTKLTAGRWAIFDGSEPFSSAVEDGSRVIAVMLPEEAMGTWPEHVGKGGRLLFRSDEGDLAALLIQDAFTRSTNLNPNAQISLERLLVDLLQSACERCVQHTEINDQARRSPPKLQCALEFISVELGNPTLRPEIIGQAVGVSRRTLYHMFRTIGHTPMSYVRAQRLQEAARRLGNRKEQGLTVTRIAYDLGFADVAHFSRLFQARFGLTPGRWARTNDHR